MAGNTSRGSVTGLVGGGARLAFTQGGGYVASGTIPPHWVHNTYSYTDTKHVHAVTTLTSGASFGYDDNGNMISRVEGGHIYAQTFDAENRLAAVTIANGGGTFQYVYDGDDQRVKTVRPDGTATVYLGLVELELTAGGTISQTTSYYELPGARVVRVGTTVSYVLTDHLGSASVTLNSSGSQVGELRYYAYGATRLSSGTQPTDQRYTGQYEEIEIGLYYYNARWYDPWLGRFISADSIVPNPGNPQSLNRYAYVLNNPLAYIDPTGYYNERNATACGPDSINCGGMYGEGTWIDQQSGQNCPATVCTYPNAPILTETALWDTTVAGGELLLAVLCELCDWVMTAHDCATGDCNPWILLAALPILPGSLGKHIDEVFPNLKPGTLSNVEARKWYLTMEAQIKGLIDTNLPLEQQARQAFDLRNQFRTWARELMADTAEAQRLMREEPNLSWEQIIERAKNKGYSGDQIWQYILDASQRSRQSINKALGLDLDK